MSEPTNNSSILQKIKKSKRTPIIAGVSFLVIVAAIGIFFAFSPVSDKISKGKTLQTIVIGDITITPQDVNAYADILRNVNKDAGGSYDESEDNMALKDLVLNAALKKEAKDKGVSLTDLQIVQQSADSSQTSENIKNTAKNFRSQDKVAIVTSENIAYKKALESKLITNQSLLIVQSAFDTPYYKTLNTDKANSVYKEVQDKINNDIVPLVKSGASEVQIAKKVDVNFIKKNKTDSQLIKMYSSQPVIALQKVDDYSPGTQVFNDIDDNSYIIGDVGQLYNTDDKLAGLKNIGDTTDLFASKSGMFMIARLDSANGGGYNSWDNFLNSYIDKNVKYAGIDASKFVANVQSLAVRATDKAIITLTSPALEKANALGYVCSNHTVRYQVATWIKPIGSNGGGPGNAQANPRVQFTPQPNGCVSNPNAGDGYLSAGETGYADCMQSAPNWGGISNTQSSGNYKFKGVYVDLGGGGPWSPGAKPGLPPEWTVATANQTHEYTNYIWFVYEPTQQKGNLNVDLSATYDCNGSGIRGAAYFRPPNTTGAQDVIVPWRLSGAIDFPGGGVYAGANTGRTDPNPRVIIYPPPNPAALFPNGQGRNITLWARYTYQGVTYTENTTEYVMPPQPFGCNPPPDYGAEASITANCGGVTSFFARDRNGTAGFRITVYHTGAGGAPIYDSGINLASADTGASGSQPINLPPLAGSNNGYYFQLDVDQIGIYGNKTGTRSVSVSTGPCYHGSCTTTVVGNVPGGAANAVQARQTFRVNYTIRDDGQLAVPGNGLSLTLPNPGADWTGTGDALVFNNGPGRSRSGTVTLTAPDRIVSQSLAFYPDYAGYFPIGSSCAVTVDVYKQFDITPKADAVTLDPYAEDPLTATFTSSTIKNNPAGTSIPGVVATRQIGRNGTQIGTFNAPNPYRAGVPSDTRNFTDTANIPQPNKLNDGFCGQITVRPAAGWIGPSDRVVVTVASASDSTQGCNGLTIDPDDPDNPGEPPRVVNQPYVKSYGGDVVAGGGFTSAGGSCAATPSSGAGIFSFIAPLNYQASRNRSGSGAQLGAFAWGANVSGFTSASMRTAAPASTSGNKLTFANTTTGDSASQEPVLGGNLGGAPPCLPDYFNDTQYPEGEQKDIGNTTSVGVASLANNKQTLYDGNLQIDGSTNYKSRHTIYVDGDAWIRNNIVYSRTGVTAATKMPNFTLVVKGNIYVDAQVTRLDGTYIAQPRDDGSKGIIYTCSSGFNAILAPQAMFNQCGAGGGARQLYVYGSFIAEKVRLNRTINSIKDSAYREELSRTAAAEVFVFSPDVYLSAPVFRPNSTATSGDYQYIATLPPIL